MQNFKFDEQILSTESVSEKINIIMERLAATIEDQKNDHYNGP